MSSNFSNATSSQSDSNVEENKASFAVKNNETKEMSVEAKSNFINYWSVGGLLSFNMGNDELFAYNQRVHDLKKHKISLMKFEDKVKSLIESISEKNYSFNAMDELAAETPPDNVLFSMKTFERWVHLKN